VFVTRLIENVLYRIVAPAFAPAILRAIDDVEMKVRPPKKPFLVSSEHVYAHSYSCWHCRVGQTMEQRFGNQPMETKT